MIDMSRRTSRTARTRPLLTRLGIPVLLAGVCAAGAFAAWELLASKYESYALLQVSSVPASLAEHNPNQARTEFSTYVTPSRRRPRSRAS